MRNLTYQELEKEYLEFKQKAENLLEDSEKFQALFDRNLHCVYVHDFEGNFIDANEASLQLLGYPRKEIPSINFPSLIGDDQLPKALKALEEIKRNGFQKSFSEYRIKTKDGSYIWVETDGSLIYKKGKPYAILGVARDITKSKRANEKLRKSEEEYRLLVENANDGIFILQDGQIKFPNLKARQMGESLGLELGRVPFADYIHPQDRNIVIDRHIRRIKGEKLPHTYSFRLVGKSGQEMWVELNTVKITWEGKAATLNFLRDITMQRKLEHQLQVSQKMEAVGILAGGIAHDFNNLLMGIQGRTSLMMLETDPVHPSYDHLSEIEDYINSATKLTKQLLGFARGGKYEVKPADLNDLLENSSQMFGRTKKEIAIYKKYDEKLWTVEVDQSQIDQVFLNIFVNAWQAMPEGGKIYIETQNRLLEDNFVSAYGLPPGRYVKVTITDTGIGMDEKTANRVFDPFFTTKIKQRGAGLGMASVYGIIKNHDGIIIAEGEKGVGAAITIYLPASDKAVNDETHSKQKILVGSETILLVDDEEMILDVGVQLLKKVGYKVLMARNGKEAIEIYKQNKDEIALVILDLIMPEMGGGEAFDKLKQIDSNVKILLSSGYSIDGQATDILKRGCDGFIQKPFKLNELSNKLRDIIAK